MSLTMRKRDLPKLILGCIGLCLCIFGIILGYPMSNFVSIYVLLMSAYLVWWSRANALFVIMAGVLAYSNYSIVFSEYVVIKANTLFTRYAGTPEAALGIYILLFFWSILMIALPAEIPSFSAGGYKDYWRTEEKSSLHFFYTVVLNVVLLIIWVVGFARPSELGERGHPSTLYEYSIVLFILCYYFGGRIKSVKISTSIILFMYALQNFVYGGRITGLQVLILFYLMCVEEKYSTKKVLPIVVGLFIVLSIIGAYRRSWLITGFSVSSVWSALKDSLFTLDTAYSAYHTSLTFLLLCNTASINTRLGVFWGFLKSIILGHYGTAENSVTQLTKRYYLHYNGGWLPFHFYFFMGWIGVALIAIYVSVFVRQLSKNPDNTSGLKKCVLVYFVTSSFRWYLYAPIQITRGILLMALTFVISDLAIKAILNRGGVQEEIGNIPVFSYCNAALYIGGAA